MEDNISNLRKIANRLRYQTFAVIAHAGGGHFGGSLSISEILTVLYFQVMKIDPQNPEDEQRDRFILSKGHGGPALYTTMALKGFFPIEELDDLDKPLSKFPKHVDRLKLKGIEASTGPLGQGLSIACGMAISLKQQKRTNRVYVLVGDGECNSGQLWEAVMTAAKYRLDNLAVIVDRNECQIDGRCDEVMPMEPLRDKFAAFGWYVLQADGHDVQALLNAFEQAGRSLNAPSVIIARTVKGRGVSFMEGRYDWHSGSLSPAQYDQGTAELKEKLS
jgi:transketolase